MDLDAAIVTITIRTKIHPPNLKKKDTTPIVIKTTDSQGMFTDQDAVTMRKLPLYAPMQRSDETTLVFAVREQNLKNAVVRAKRLRCLF